MHYVTPILKIHATIKRDDPQDYPPFVVSGFDPKHLNMSPIGPLFTVTYFRPINFLSLISILTKMNKLA